LSLSVHSDTPDSKARICETRASSRLRVDVVLLRKSSLVGVHMPIYKEAVKMSKIMESGDVQCRLEVAPNRVYKCGCSVVHVSY
jgi:hypothetical protein